MGLFDAIDGIRADMKKRKNVKKGNTFEEYVENELFPEDLYDMMHRTHRTDMKSRYVESQLMPDFRFRDRKSGHIFWVEAKYRSNFFKGKLEWSSYAQFKRYKEHQEEVRPEKVFIAIGFQGKPTSPENVYIIPLDELKYPAVYPSVLKGYEVKYSPAKYSGGRIR